MVLKVAKVVNDKPDFECMVEGHTDNVPLMVPRYFVDNWDLSVETFIYSCIESGGC
jgi:chemotaxis protein MotB